MGSGNAPKRPGGRAPTRPSRPPSSTKAKVPTELEATQQELREALEQHAALRDVLGAISRSPFVIDAVLDTVIQNAVRLSGADSGSVSRIENGVGSLVAHVGMTDEAVANNVEFYRTHPLVAGRRSMVGRVLMERRSVQIPDASAETDYDQTASYPRSLLGVPLLGPDGIVGVIVVRRRIVGGRIGFSEQHVRLVEAFAAQAVIATENVRLFNETREALAQQTAVADVLKTISGSAFELQPVLDAVITSAVRLCSADSGFVFRYEGDGYRTAASHGVPAELVEFQFGKGLMPLGEKSLRRTGHYGTVQIHDILAEADVPPGLLEDQKRGGFRTVLGVPMRREGVVLGVISLRRNEVRAFSEREIGLVETFADQAVIAIENVRLFNETKEALDRQTALAEILRVISQSPTDVQPVLEAIADSAARFCAAEDASVGLMEGEVWRVRAHRGPIEIRLVGSPIDATPAMGPTFVSGRAMLERRTIHVPDLQAVTDQYPDGAAASPTTRAIVATPLLSAAGPIGALFLRRTEATPFTERQIGLAETFAAQAVIAIENVRLFNETKEALERQTATADVLRVISRSTFDLRPVLEALIETAARLANAQSGVISGLEGDNYRSIAAYGLPAELRATQLDLVSSIATGTSIAARTARALGPVQVADALADPAASPKWLELSRAQGNRTILGVPLLRDGIAIGALSLRRTEVKPFNDREIALVQSFADQAVIAIENTRLLNEIQDKSRQLAAASRHKSEFMANMSHELRTPLNAIIGFSDVLEQRMYGTLNDQQSEYIRDIAGSGRHLLDLVNEILDLSKVEAGKMELEPSEFDLAETIRGAVGFVRERAAAHHIGVATDLPAELGTVVADERKLRQVLLNLLSNAVKFTPDKGTIEVRARRTAGEVEVSVRDTGIGIAAADQARVFDEFRQVGKASDRSREGTGLGLTLAKRFVELHGGRIWVESEIGKGTTFTFAISVGRAATAPAS